jgi:hypothetical protein
MTISLVMSDKRPTWSIWLTSRPERSKREDLSLGPSGPDDHSTEEEARSMMESPPRLAMENDLALARMMGCAFLFGIACIIGLLVLIF